MISRNTVIDSAKVVLTSAVGTMRRKVWCAVSSPAAAVISADGISSGSRSMVFMNTTQTKMVSASGAMKRRSP